MTVHSSDSLSNRWYSDSTIGGTPGIGKTVDVTPSVSVGTLTVQLETPSVSVGALTAYLETTGNNGGCN